MRMSLSLLNSQVESAHVALSLGSLLPGDLHLEAVVGGEGVAEGAVSVVDAVVAGDLGQPVAVVSLGSGDGASHEEAGGDDLEGEVEGKLK